MNTHAKPSNDSGIILLCAVITAILMLLASGCSQTSVTYGTAKFRRTSLGTDLGLQELTVSTNGAITIKGLVNAQAQSAGAIAEGVARGLKP